MHARVAAERHEGHAVAAEAYADSSLAAAHRLRAELAACQSRIDKYQDCALVAETLSARHLEQQLKGEIARMEAVAMQSRETARRERAEAAILNASQV